MSAKDPAAVALGSKGGKARASTLDAEQRAGIARKAATKKWANWRKDTGRKTSPRKRNP
jgi:hypothetical protein